MIDAGDFTRRQCALLAEFGLYVFDHPEVDDLLPEGAHVYFEADGESEFNAYSRKMAEQQGHKEEGPVVIVRVKGLAPVQSRLLEPRFETLPVVAAEVPHREKRPRNKRTTPRSGRTRSAS